MSRSSRRAIGWAIFALLLVGLAFALHELLPPEPRWSLAGKLLVDELAVDNATCFTYPRAKEFRGVTSRPRQGPLVQRDLRTGAEIRRVVEAHEQFCQVARSADGRQLAVSASDANDSDLWLMDLTTGRGLEIRYRRGQEDALRFSAGGEVLLAGCSLIDTAAGRVLARGASDSRSCLLDVAGNRAAVVVHDGRTEVTKVYDIRERRWSGQLAAVTSISHLSPDGRFLVGWRPAPDDGTRCVVADLDRQTTIPVGTHWSQSSTRWCFSSDSRLLAVWQAGGHLELWDLRGRERRLREEVERTTASVFFSPDARWCGVLDYTPFEYHPGAGRVNVYDTTGGEWRWSVNRPALDTRASFTRDNRGLVIFSAAGLELLDVATGTVRGVIRRPNQWSGVCPDLSSAKNGRRWVVARHVRNRDDEPGWLRRCRDWLGVGQRTDSQWMEVSVIDVASCSESLHLALPQTGRVPWAAGGLNPSRSQARLSDDGQSLLLVAHSSWDDVDAASPLCCYDVSARKPWRWVLGPPTALGGVVLGMWAWRRRRA